VVLPDPVSPLYSLATERPLLPSLTKLDAALRGARLLVVCSPNNPTGAILPDGELERIALHARKRDVLILSDESFAAFAHDAEPGRMATFARSGR